MKLFVIRDESSEILGQRCLNLQISLYLGLLQLTVCIWATAQHFFSIFHYNRVLFCDFINGTEPVLLVGVDMIIFDIGLFHSLWGIDGCVAQYLDGGYGRFVWCICHILAFFICLPMAFVSRPRPYSLWPLLIQQSAYGIGLLILSLAALPRVLLTFTGGQNSASLLSVSVYAVGTSLNFFLLYIYWHGYWHVETMWNAARKLRLHHTNLLVTNQRSCEQSLKSVTDSIIPLQQSQLQNSYSRIQPVTSLKLLTEICEQQVTTVVPENLCKTKNLVDRNNYGYHRICTTNSCQKSSDKCNDADVMYYEKAGLLRAISQDGTKCYDNLTVQPLQYKMLPKQPALPTARRQTKNPGPQPSTLFISHEYRSKC